MSLKRVSKKAFFLDLKREECILENMALGEEQVCAHHRCVQYLDAFL